MCAIVLLFIFTQCTFGLEFYRLGLGNHSHVGTLRTRYKRAYTRWTSDGNERATPKFLVQVYDETEAPAAAPAPHLMVRDTRQHERIQKKPEPRTSSTKLQEIGTKQVTRHAASTGRSDAPSRLLRLAHYTRFKPHRQKISPSVEVSKFATENRLQYGKPIHAEIQPYGIDHQTPEKDVINTNRTMNLRDNKGKSATENANRTVRGQQHNYQTHDAESSEVNDDLSDEETHSHEITDAETEIVIGEFDNPPIKQLRPPIEIGSVPRWNNKKHYKNKDDKTRVTSIFETELTTTKNMHGFNMYIDVEDKPDSDAENIEIEPDMKELIINKIIQNDLNDKRNKENKKFDEINKEKKLNLKIHKTVQFDQSENGMKEFERWNEMNTADNLDREYEYIEIESDKKRLKTDENTQIDINDKRKKESGRRNKISKEKDNFHVDKTIKIDHNKNRKDKFEKWNEQNTVHTLDRENDYFEIASDKKQLKTQGNINDKGNKENERQNKDKQKLKIYKVIQIDLNNKGTKESEKSHNINKGDSKKVDKELKLFSDDSDMESETNEINLVKYYESNRIPAKILTTTTKSTKKTTLFKKNTLTVTKIIKFEVKTHAGSKPTSTKTRSRGTTTKNHSEETTTYDTTTHREFNVTTPATTQTTENTTDKTSSTEDDFFSRSCKENSKNSTFDFFTAHCTADIIAQIDAWVANHSIAKRVDIVPGSAMLLGNPVVMVIVDDRRQGQSKDDKHVAMIVAGIHGRDHHAVAAAMYLLYELIEKTAANMELIQQYRFWIIPVFNPDGYDYSLKYHKTRNWMKNLRQNWEQSDACKKRGIGCVVESCKGVNLDRNFEYQWLQESCELNRRYEDRCHDLFPGTLHLSEPETRNLTEYLRSAEVIPKYFIALKEGQILRRRAARAAIRMKSIAGRTYIAGQTSEFLPLYAGGIEDWMEGYLGVENSYCAMLNTPDYADNVTLEQVSHEGFVAVETILKAGRAVPRARIVLEKNGARRRIGLAWPQSLWAAVQTTVCLLIHHLILCLS